MSLETVQGVVVKIQASEAYVYPSCSNCNAKLGTQPGYRASPGLRRTTQALNSPNVKKPTQNNIATPIKTLTHIKALTPGPQIFCSRCHSNYLREHVSFKYRLSFVLAQAHEYRAVTVFGDDLDVIFGCDATDFRKFTRVISQKTKLDKLELKNRLLESLESVMLGQLFELRVTKVKATKSSLLQKRRTPLSDKTSEYLAKLRITTNREEWRVKKIWPVYRLPNSVFLHLREKLNLAPDCLSKEDDLCILRLKNLTKALEEKKRTDTWFCEFGQLKDDSSPSQAQSIAPLCTQNIDMEWEYGNLDEVDISSESMELTSKESHLETIQDTALPKRIPNPSPLTVVSLNGDVDSRKAIQPTTNSCQQSHIYSQERSTPLKNRHLLQVSNTSPSIHITTPREIDLSASQTSQFFEDFCSSTPKNGRLNHTPDLSITPEPENWIKPAETPSVYAVEVCKHEAQNYERPRKSNQTGVGTSELLVAETPENPKPEPSLRSYTPSINDQTPTKSHSFTSLQLTGCRWHPLLRYHQLDDGFVSSNSTIPTSEVYAIIPETPLNPPPTSKNILCTNSSLDTTTPSKSFVPETPAKISGNISNNELTFWLDDEVIPPSDEEDLRS